MFINQSPVIPLLLVLSLFSCACLSSAETRSVNSASAATYKWTRLTDAAAFPPSYNFPVYVAQGKMWAFHGQGIWNSDDGKVWVRSGLTPLRNDIYATQYVQFKDAVYALGDNRGNYQHITFGSKIRRTTDFKKWETLAESSKLPDRIFYGLLVYNGKIWILGGYDGRQYFNDVWNSSDGVTWTRVMESAGWSPRTSPTVIAYKDKLWLIGGGMIDGTPEVNPSSHGEVWSSANGKDWIRSSSEMPLTAGGQPVVFDGKLWLIGANRDGNFGRSSLVTNDMNIWHEESAPWSPRGGAAAWEFKDKLYMTGGKYSVTENGQIKFIYSNDVWVMDKTN